MGTDSVITGLRIGDSYELVSQLGAGGMGEVWKAKHLRLPKFVAIKFLHIATNDEIYKRFRREAEISSQLGHPNIAHALDFNQLDDGTPYMVLEYLEGETLRERMQRKPLNRPELIDVVKQICSALGAAHDANVVHRDLKPENVFLVKKPEGDLHVKILDFGISKLHGAETQLTQADRVFGTPQYMSPEQARGRTQDITTQSDQFALAAIVYELVAGRPAFNGDEPLAILYQIVNEQPQPLPTASPSSPALVPVIERGMSKDVASRFPSISSFAQAIVTALETDRPDISATLPPETPAAVIGARTGPPAAENIGLANTVATDAPVAIAPAASGQLEQQSQGPMLSPMTNNVPSVKTKRTVLTGVLVIALIGGALAGWWLFRGGAGPQDNRQSMTTTTPTTNDAAASTTKPDIGAASGDSNTADQTAPSPADARPEKPDQRIVVRVKTKRKVRPRPKQTPIELLQMLQEERKKARQAALKGDWDGVERIARRLLVKLPRRHRKRAFALRAIARCGQRQYHLARDDLKHLRGALYFKTVKRCKKLGYHFKR